MIMMQKEVWSQSVDEVLRRFKTTRSGLSGETAKEWLQTTGENVLEEGKKKTAGQIFLSQFCDLLVVILLIAGGISMISGSLESTAVIRCSAANAVLGTIQQIKAVEVRLKSLKNLSSRTAE
ncbi:MAG: cation-transporting P-type ATPase [Lachnospiraceae bacterium]